MYTGTSLTPKQENFTFEIDPFLLLIARPVYTVVSFLTSFPFIRSPLYLIIESHRHSCSKTIFTFNDKERGEVCEISS